MPYIAPDLLTLRLLAALQTQPSLSAAAKRFGIAQPNASRAITNLETSVGLQLVQRSPSGSTLTATGKNLADAAERILGDYDHLNRVIDHAQHKHRTSLRVATSLTVGEHLIPTWVRKLRRSPEHAEVSAQLMNSSRVFHAVTSGSAEIGFVETPNIPDRLHSEPVTSDELWVVVAPDHPWTRLTGPLTSKELADTPLLVREPGSGTRIALEQSLAPLRLHEPALELGSNSAIIATVKAGNDAAVLSRLAVDTWVRRGELARIPLADSTVTRDIHAVWKVGNLGDLARELVAIAKTPLDAQ
jgi:molybdate transport repressor ModE-like protein